MQISFEDCLLDIERRELRRSNQLVAVEPQVFDVLIYLVENRDRVVSKATSLRLCGRPNGCESTLHQPNKCRAKGDRDTGEKQNLIRTFARKGVRFVAPVNVASEQRAPALTVPQRPSIAVLPFTNERRSGQDSFVDGVTEEIIPLCRAYAGFLSSHVVRPLLIKARTSLPTRSPEARCSLCPHGQHPPLRRSNSVSAKLIDGNSRSNVWARSYDRALSDIFAVQDEITQTIVGGIEPELSRAERNARGSSTGTASTRGAFINAACFISIDIRVTIWSRRERFLKARFPSIPI